MLPPRDRITPPPVEPADAPAAARTAGEEALRRGEVAALLVAGGQGSRLGFDKPKGMFPVGPVSKAPLFQVHAEKVLALSRRYGRPVPFLVMTSPATHADTVGFFREHRFFGLAESDVRAADAVVEVCAAHAASGCYWVWIAKEKREERSLRQGVPRVA